MKRRFTLACALLAACTSSHDLGSGPSAMGGGVFHEVLRPGLHYIVIKSNVAPWANQDAVAGQWREVAARLCKTAYRERRVEALVVEELRPMNVFFIRLPYLVSVHKGYALCEGAGLSDDEVDALIDAPR